MLSFQIKCLRNGTSSAAARSEKKPTFCNETDGRRGSFRPEYINEPKPFSDCAAMQKNAKTNPLEGQENGRRKPAISLENLSCYGLAGQGKNVDRKSPQLPLVQAKA
jgi:hypothetical protein